MKLNDNQQKVLDTFISKNICFVNASAGTGKTTTLIKSYIALLEKEKIENYNAEKIVKSIVVITFTKAAANEMLIRIRSTIRLKIKEARENKEKKYWQDIYNSVLSNNNITTIHAFAQKLVSENALYLGLPSTISIFEENDDFVDNLHHIIDKLLEKSVNGKKIYSLYELYIIDKREAFISEVINFINTIKPRLESIENFEKKIYELIETKENFDDIVSQISSDNIDICMSFQSKSKSEKSNNAIANAKYLLSNLKNILGNYTQNKDDDVYIKELFESVLSVAEFSVGTVAVDFKKIYNEIRELCEKIKDILEYKVYKKEISSFLNFIKEAYTKIEDTKIRSGVYSHDDIISIAIDALEDSEVGERIRNSIKAIVLDEAQDTSALQFNFVNLIIFGKRSPLQSDIDNIGEKRLFIVGDKKQSIYRFRDANVDEFLRVEEKLSKYKNVLKDNYRSNQNLISFFNDFFANNIFVDDRINYTENDNLIDYKKSESEKSIDFLALNHNTNDGDKIKARESYSLEALAIASYIEKNLKENEYKDSTILLRGFPNLYLYLDALSKHKIPFYVDGGSGFYQREEISEISGFLYYLFLFEDSSLDLLLTFRFFDISIDNIFSFKNALKKENLQIDDYISIHKHNNNEYKKAESIALKMSFYNKLSEIKTIINNLQNNSYTQRGCDIIENICLATNYYAYVATRIDAEIAIANIEKLKDMARDYEHSTGKTAYDFVIHIKNQSENSESLAQVPKLDIDALQIMTIHKSKGLEFKNTFFSSIGSKFNTANYSKLYFCDDVPVIKLPVSKERTIVFPKLDENELKSKNESERKRLLYVALTRASDRLVLSGETSKPSYRDMFDNYFANTSKDIVSSSMNITSEATINIAENNNLENDKANIYIYGRGIKLSKAKENYSTKDSIYSKVIEGIEECEIAEKIENTKKIKINTASKSSKTKTNYNLESLMVRKLEYTNDDKSYDNEDEYSEAIYIKPSPADIGTSIHALLEKFDFEFYKKEKDNYKNKLVETALIDFSSYDENYIKHAISTSIDSFLNDKHIKNIVEGNEYIVMREHSFQKTYTDSFGNINIDKGKIDLITKDKEDKYYIIDYKNTEKTKEKEELYASQMSIYKDILSGAMDIDKNKIETYLMFLK